MEYYSNLHTSMESYSTLHSTMESYFGMDSGTCLERPLNIYLFYHWPNIKYFKRESGQGLAKRGDVR